MHKQSRVHAAVEPSTAAEVKSTTLKDDQGTSGSLGARNLHKALEDRIADEPISSPASGKTEPPNKKEPSASLRRSIKVGVGIAIVAIFGWVPLQTLLQTSSVEAVINSRLVTLRSPIDGEVSARTAVLSNSGIVQQGTTVLRISNPRADRARLDDLRRQLAKLENERPSLVLKLSAAEVAQKDLAQQAARFTQGRILQLEARIAELQSLIETATARREESTAAAERATSLVRSGTVSTAEFARLTRDRITAEQTEIGARRRLDANKIELTAAQEGTFLGDSYNDRPSSVQREEEMRQRINTLTADLTSADSEMAWLRGEVTQEKIRHSNLSEAAITLPVSGRIWEIMTTPGEDVRAGQPLLRLLDCSGAVVTANVTESVYNHLQVGASARFKPADGGQDLDGVILNLTGAAGAAANLAISPDALSKEPYRVTVSIPELTLGSRDCPVGRTGRVIFTGDNARQP